MPSPLTPAVLGACLSWQLSGILGHPHLSFTLGALLFGSVFSRTLVFTLTSLDSIRNNFLKMWVLQGFYTKFYIELNFLITAFLKRFILLSHFLIVWLGEQLYVLQITSA